MPAESSCTVAHLKKITNLLNEVKAYMFNLWIFFSLGFTFDRLDLWNAFDIHKQNYILSKYLY